MLPHVHDEDRLAAQVGRAHHQRVVVARRGADRKLALPVHIEPAPAGRKLCDGGGVELLLEGGEVAEGLLDVGEQFTAGQAAGARREEIPVEVVVPGAAGVVADGGTDILRHILEVRHQILESFAVQPGMLVEGGIEVVDVGGVMLVMVQTHGLLVHERLERVVGIGQVGQFDRHVVVPFD